MLTTGHNIPSNTNNDNKINDNHQSWEPEHQKKGEHNSRKGVETKKLACNNFTWIIIIIINGLGFYFLFGVGVAQNYFLFSILMSLEW